jgi:hypothetical protein
MNLCPAFAGHSFVKQAKLAQDPINNIVRPSELIPAMAPAPVRVVCGYSEFGIA